jgi:hypothetical protein
MDTIKIRAVMEEADKIIQQVPNRTANAAMLALREHAEVLKHLRANNHHNHKSRRTTRARSQSSSSSSSVASHDSTTSDSTMNGMEDFKFTYEEESDPEIFFIPYLWEVIVSTVTSSLLEWDRKNIRVFAIMHHVVNAAAATSDETNVAADDLLTTAALGGTNEFSKDVDDVV